MALLLSQHRHPTGVGDASRAIATDSAMEETVIRRVSGTERPNIVCKFCAHVKAWHPKEGPCRARLYSDGRMDCDCEAWDYGANVEEVER